MATFKDIQEANASIKTTDIKGKSYAEVNQRLLAFRTVYPEGTIKTEMLTNEGGLCVFKAEAWNLDILLGTGHAYEREQSSYINKTSYIENCETSAVGRALGMCGFGIDTSVASKEEAETAIQEQERLKNMTDEERMLASYPPREQMIAFILNNYDDDNLATILNYYQANRLEDLKDTELVVAYNRKKR